MVLMQSFFRQPYSLQCAAYLNDFRIFLPCSIVFNPISPVKSSTTFFYQLICHSGPYPHTMYKAIEVHVPCILVLIFIFFLQLPANYLNALKKKNSNFSRQILKHSVKCSRSFLFDRLCVKNASGDIPHDLPPFFKPFLLQYSSQVSFR